MSHGRKLAVIGLGYVGLPLAVQLAKHFETWGLDINSGRIAELQSGFDRTDEIDEARLLLDQAIARAAGSPGSARVSRGSTLPVVVFRSPTFSSPNSRPRSIALRRASSFTRTVRSSRRATECRRARSRRGNSTQTPRRAGCASNSAHAICRDLARWMRRLASPRQAR